MENNSEPTIGGMPEARLEWHFDNYRRWMRAGTVTDGLPGRSAVVLGGGNSATFEELVDSADMRCAQVVDALMLGLSHGERAAVNPVYLYAVFRFPRDNLATLLASGRFKIARGLVSRGFY